MGVLIVMTYQKEENKDLNKFLNDEDYTTGSSWHTYNPDPSRAMLSLEGGIDLLAGGGVQGLLSYAFFDPVLTDRAFLTDPRTMARSFMIGGTFAGLIILLFGFIGIYGSMLGKCVDNGVCKESDLNGAELSDVMAGKPFAVAQTMGDVTLFLTAFIMILSSVSTLDSTFTSTAKLLGPDMNGIWMWFGDMFSGKVSPFASSRGEAISKYMPMALKDTTNFHVLMGRGGMLFMATVGTLALLDCPTQLSATTVSGTMVAGLGAPIYMVALLPDTWLWTRGTKRPLAFCTSFLFCAMIGKETSSTPPPTSTSFLSLSARAHTANSSAATSRAPSSRWSHGHSLPSTTSASSTRCLHLLSSRLPPKRGSRSTHRTSRACSHSPTLLLMMSTRKRRSPWRMATESPS